MSFRYLVLVLVAVAIFAGCKRSDEVQVYQAPKDRAAKAPGASGPPSANATDQANPESAPRPPWVVPDGWAEKPSTGGMRIATYAVTAPDGRTVDISVVPLGGAAGSMLDNVNRWRKEVELGPIAETDLPALRQTVKIGEVDGDWYEMVSEKPILDGKYRVRTLAAILPLSGTTVFFKAKGEDSLVRENADKMKAWLKSVQTGAPPPASAAPSADGGAAPNMRGPVAPPPSTALPVWEIPPGWKSVPASTMRLATFAITGSNQQSGDVSVVALGPAAGGALANINRWRNQFELAPLEESGLAKATTTMAVQGNDQATVVELAGQGASTGKRMLAAIVARPDRTWFYKLTGSDALVASERDNFFKFIKSVKYP